MFSLYNPGFLMFEELSKGFENYSGRARLHAQVLFFAPAPNEDPFAGLPCGKFRAGYATDFPTTDGEAAGTVNPRCAWAGAVSRRGRASELIASGRVHVKRPGAIARVRAIAAGDSVEVIATGGRQCEVAPKSRSQDQNIVRRRRGDRGGQTSADAIAIRCVLTSATPS